MIKISQLLENSLYKDDKEKAEYLDNVKSVSKSFVFNFLGILGLLNGTTNKTPIIAYFKKDKQVRLDNIGDDNNNTSLVIKHMSDLKLFKKDSTVTQITKFLAKLKTGAVTEVEDDTVRGWIKELPAGKLKLSGKTLPAFTEFKKGNMTLIDLAASLQNVANKQPKLAGEFHMLSKKVGSVASKATAKLTFTPNDRKDRKPVAQQPKVAADPVAKKVSVATVIKKAKDTVAATSLSKIADEFMISGLSNRKDKYYAEVYDYIDSGLTLTSYTAEDVENAFVEAWNTTSVTNPGTIHLMLTTSKPRIANGLTKFGYNTFSLFRNNTLVQSKINPIILNNMLMSFINDSLNASSVYEPVNADKAKDIEDRVFLRSLQAAKDNGYASSYLPLDLDRTDIWATGGLFHNEFKTLMSSETGSSLIDMIKLLLYIAYRGITWASELVKGVYGTEASLHNLEAYNPIFLSTGVMPEGDLGKLFHLLRYGFRNKNLPDNMVISDELFSFAFSLHTSGVNLPTGLSTTYLVKKVASSADGMKWILKQPNKNSLLTDIESLFSNQVVLDKIYDNDINLLKEILNGLLDRYLVTQVGRDNGLGLGHSLVDKTAKAHKVVSELISERVKAAIDKDMNKLLSQGKDVVPWDYVYTLNDVDFHPLVDMYKDKEFVVVYNLLKKQLTPASATTRKYVEYSIKYPELSDTHTVLTRIVHDDNVEYTPETLQYIQNVIDGFGDGDFMYGYGKHHLQLLLNVKKLSVEDTSYEDLMSVMMHNMPDNGPIQLMNTIDARSAMFNAKDKAKLLMAVIKDDGGKIMSPESALDAIIYNTLGDSRDRFGDELVLNMKDSPFLQQVFSHNTIKTIRDRSTKSQIKDMVFSGILDKIDSNPAEADGLYNALDSSLQGQIRNSLTGVAILTDDLNNSPIKTFGDMTSDRLKKVLSFNDLDPNKLSKGGIRKKKNENLSGYYTRIKSAKENGSMGLEAPKVEEITHAEKELNKITIDLIKKYYAGRHGRIYPKVNRVFNASIPHDEYDAFLEQARANGNAEQINPCFHGTGGIAASMILRYGFKVLKSSDASVVGRMLGDGIYFSNKIDKSLQYVGNDGYGRGVGVQGYLFEMESVLGRQGTDYESAGVRDNSTRSPEWVVMDARKQLKFVKVYEVEIINHRQYEALKESVNESNSVGDFMTRGKIGDDQIGFTFHDGMIPLQRKEPAVDFEDVILPQGVIVEKTARGPMVLFTHTTETAYFDIRYGSDINGDVADRYFELLNNYRSEEDNL